MYILNKKLTKPLSSCAAVLAVFACLGLVSSAQASILNKSAFIDTFDDGIVNTSVYSPIGNALISESGGKMTVEASANEGISVNFNNVIPESNWMGFEFETINFSPNQGFRLDVRDQTLEGNEFISLSINIEPVGLVNILQDNGQKKDLEITWETFDNEGNSIDNATETVKKEAEAPSNGTWILFLDWRTIKGNNKWFIDIGADAPASIKKVVLNATEDVPNKELVKFIDLTVSTGDDPMFVFNIIGADPMAAAHVSEHTSTFSLLSFGTLGAALTLKRKLKASKSVRPEL